MLLKERSFNLSLSFSILIHMFLLFFLSVLNILPKQEVVTNLEINYIKRPLKNTLLIKKTPKETPGRDNLEEKISLKQRIVLSEEDKIPERNSLAKQKLNQGDMLTKSRNALLKPSLPRIELLPRSDIKLSLAEPSKFQSPAYLGYRNFLHETLRRYLYDRYSDSMERGEVYLTFVLDSGGAVKDAQVIDSKSTAGENLKRIVLESLYAASPFPPLPQTLNVPVLTFSVIIHFKEREIE